MNKPLYLVVGWTRDSTGYLKFAFRIPNSSRPGKDVEKALESQCISVDVVELIHGRNLMEQGESYVEEAARILRAARSKWPPVSEGPVVYDITGKVTRPKESGEKYVGILYKTSFQKEGSTTPGEDVERALIAGSKRVYVSKRNTWTSPEAL